MQHIKSWEPYWKDVTVPAARRASADSGVTAQSLGLNPLGGGGFPLVLAHWFQMVLMSFQRRPRKRFRFLRRIIDFYVPLSEIAPRTLTLEVPCWVKSAVFSVRRPSRSQTYFSFQFLNRVKLWRSGVTDSAGEMETMPCLCLSCYSTIMSRRVTFVSYNMHVKSAVIFCICMKIISMHASCPLWHLWFPPSPACWEPLLGPGLALMCPRMLSVPPLIMAQKLSMLSLPVSLSLRLWVQLDTLLN